MLEQRYPVFHMPKARKLRISEIKKNNADIRRGLVLMAIEGPTAQVAAIAAQLQSAGYPSTNCSEVGDNDGEMVEFFSISRADKADFTAQYKLAKASRSKNV
jgi:hypothetical protein